MAKKRYHQSVKDRMAESRGEEKHLAAMHREMAMHSDADYSDYDKRRRMERMDGNMIHEDHAAPANLPQQPIMKYWHENRSYMPEVLDDTIRGIDSQIDEDDAARKGGFSPHKF